MEQFNEEDYSNTKASLDTWKKIIKTVLINRKQAFLMITMIVLVAILDVTYPLLNEYAINHYFQQNQDMSNYDNVGFFITIYIFIAIAYFITVSGFLYFAGYIETHTSYNLRKQAYENLQKLPFSYFDLTPLGWIMARMTSDSRKLANIISWGCIDLLWSALTMMGILIVVMIKNFKLALIIICLLPFLMFVSIYFRNKMLKSYRNVRKINSQITASLNEGFMGSKTTKSLVIEEKNSNEFRGLVYNYRRNALRSVLFSSLFGPCIFILGYIGVAGTLYAGSFMVLDHAIQVGLLYVFIDYTIKFFDPVMSISRILADFQQAQASAERIVSLIETKPEIEDTKEVIAKYGTIFDMKKENFEPINGDIEFKNVSFKYNRGETVLKDFNLKIKAGTSVALVGHTGSGKSTIVNLVCRFYEPTSGEILIDGRNYKERSISWLHSNLGYVLQSPQLFSGTIKDNIKYGKLDATDEEVIAVCKMINAHDFIMKMEKGYDSEVGEGGNKLSQGQRQLISFARALIKDPRIIILDEATSSIDTQTEKMIQDALKISLKGRTSLMIAHRLSTVVDCDLILVLKDGIIIEHGTHKELLMQQGYYYSLYKNQFIKENESKIE